QPSHAAARVHGDERVIGFVQGAKGQEVAHHELPGQLRVAVVKRQHHAVAHVDGTCLLAGAAVEAQVQRLLQARAQPRPAQRSLFDEPYAAAGRVLFDAEDFVSRAGGQAKTALDAARRFPERCVQGFVGAHADRSSAPSTGGSSLPGLSRLSGSKACFNARMARSVGASNAVVMYGRFSRPMPCSPLSVPPWRSAASKIASMAWATRRISSGSRSSQIRSGWKLPSPAWPKTTKVT